MMLKRFAFLFMALALLAGCHNEKTRNLIDRRSDQAIQLSEQARTPAPKKSFDPLTVTDDIWVGDASMRMRRGRPLPEKYESSRGIALISGRPLSLQDIATAVGGQTGIPVRVSSDVTGGIGGATAAPVASVTPTGMPAESEDEDGMVLAYEGSLTGLLDLVSGHFAVNWRYDGSSITFSRYETRVFVVESLPGSLKVTDGIKEASSSSGGSSSSAEAGGSYSMSSSGSLSQSSEMEIELKVWDEISETITAMLNGVGSVVVSPSSGTIAVTTTPEVMRVVAKYIEEENHRLSQQIAINVEIYSVTLSEGTDFSLTFNEALKSLKSFGVSYSGPTGPTGSSSPSYGAGDINTGIVTSTDSGDVLTGAISGGGSLAVAILDGEISSLFSALSSIGDTTRVAQFPMTTLNNRTVSRRIGRDRTYVASITNSDSDDTYSTSTITPGTVREGFSLQVTPRLLQDGRIMMQYSMSLIDVVTMESFDTGAGAIQLPETSNRVFVQQAMLKSGSTLIVGGYDDEQVTQTSQGVGSAYNYFLGGGSTNSKDRAMLIIAITPQVLNIKRAE